MFILLEKIKVIKPWEIYQNKVSTKILMHDKAQNQNKIFSSSKEKCRVSTMPFWCSYVYQDFFFFF